MCVSLTSLLKEVPTRSQVSSQNRLDTLKSTPPPPLSPPMAKTEIKKIVAQSEYIKPFYSELVFISFPILLKLF